MLRNYDCREATVATEIPVSRIKRVSGWRPGYNRVSKFAPEALIAMHQTFNLERRVQVSTGVLKSL